MLFDLFICFRLINGYSLLFPKLINMLYHPKPLVSDQCQLLIRMKSVPLRILFVSLRHFVVVAVDVVGDFFSLLLLFLVYDYGSIVLIVLIK